MAKASRVAARQAQSLEEVSRKLDLIMEHLGIGKEQAEEVEEEATFSYEGLTDDELNVEVQERAVNVLHEGEEPVRADVIRALQRADEIEGRPAGRVSTGKDVFDGMTGAELRELADSNNVDITGMRKNADIAGALRAAGAVSKSAKK